MSVKIYTHKKHLKDLKLIEPELFYDATVINAVKEGIYEFDDTIKALIAEEKGVLKIDGQRLETKYGNFTIKDLSFMTKLKITMYFIKDFMFDDYVVCLDRTGKNLADALKIAEELNLSVFLRFEFFADSWSKIRTEVQINDEPETYVLADIVFKYAFESSGINDFGLSSETNISFSGNNATYNLWLSTVKTNIIANSIFLKKALMRDLRKSADKGTLKIVATNQSTLENIEIEPNQLLFVNRRNLSYVRDKILANQEPYILIYDNDYDIVEEMLYSVGNKAVNTIAIRTADETSYYNNTLLVEKELVADGRKPTRFEYTLKDDSFCVERRADLKFEKLDFDF